MSSATIGHSSRFPSFEPDPTASLVQNFSRLAIEQKWSKKSAKYKEERRAYLGETVQTAFLNQFGSTVERLEAWQSLCWTIGVPASNGEETEVGLGSIKACQKVSSCSSHLVRSQRVSRP